MTQRGRRFLVVVALPWSGRMPWPGPGRRRRRPTRRATTAPSSSTTPFDDHPNNQPHVGCVFQVDFYGYDEGDLDATGVTSRPTHQPSGRAKTRCC